MSDEYGPIEITRKSGAERFAKGKQDLGSDVLGFWQWSSSDLISNTHRGILAEYIVARALGIDVGGVREPWAAFDLEMPADDSNQWGGLRIEVKSSAYLQSWQQKKPSAISFGVKRTHAWDPISSRMHPDSKHQADVYVFALLAHQDQPTLDPLDVSQWEFYVLSTSVLEARTRNQKSITLRTLRALTEGPVSYENLAEAITPVRESIALTLDRMRAKKAA